MTERVSIRLHLTNGQAVLWHKGGRVHDLSPELVPVWVANFKPALFQALPDGHIVPRGSEPQALDIVRVEAAS